MTIREGDDKRGRERVMIGGRREGGDRWGGERVMIRGAERV